MLEIETADYPPGTIAQVMQPGYVIADRLLRPALVGVAKAPRAGAAGERAEPEPGPARGRHHRLSASEADRGRLGRSASDGRYTAVGGRSGGHGRCQRCALRRAGSGA